jgi:hypothetical protein
MLISDSPAIIHFLVHFMVQRYEFSDSIMAGSFYPLKHFIYDIFRLFVIMKNQLLTLCFLAIAGVAGAQTCDVTFDGPYAKIYNEGGRSTHRLVHLGNNNRLAGFIIDNSEEVDQVVSRNEDPLLSTSVNDIDWDDDEWPDVDDWSLPVDRLKEQDPVLLHELFDQDQELDDEVVAEAPKERPVKGPVSIDPLLGF